MRAATAYDEVFEGLTIEQMLLHDVRVKPKSRAFACSFCCIALAAFAFHHVAADLEFSSALDILIRQPAIAN
jgi:hypothetical protein